MNVLILGGTQFVGRHIVEALLAAGHSVSILNRGKSHDGLPACVERLRGDRDEGPAGLSALAGRTWDACVDVSGFMPRQVRPSVERLRERVDRYVFVSAVSVYGDPREVPVTEAWPRLPPAGEEVTEINADTYGPLKVACENIVEQTYGDRCTLLRPQIVAGPHDPFDRFSYWVRRTTLGGEMLAPGDGSDHLQIIDARDVARFTNTAIENGLGGSFNLAGPRLTWAEFINVLGAKNVVWVSSAAIRAAGVNEHTLPLYRPERGPRSSLMHVSNARAIQAGLNLTPLETTIDDMRQWLLSGSNDAALRPALAPQLEAELIRAARTSARHANEAAR